MRLLGLVLQTAVLALVAADTTMLGGQPTDSGPRFSDYRVAAAYRGPVARPRFRPGSDAWPDSDPRFRRQVAFDLAKGPNFAGAYVVVMTSCGTECSYVVVVDARTGEIHEDLPFRMVVVGPRDQYRGLVFGLTSRLLIVEGFVDGSVKPTRSYYEWSERSLRLIHAAPLRHRGPSR